MTYVECVPGNLFSAALISHADQNDERLLAHFAVGNQTHYAKQLAGFHRQGDRIYRGISEDPTPGRRIVLSSLAKKSLS